MRTAARDAAMQVRVMAGIERLMDGAGPAALDGLSDEEQNLVLIISGRAVLQFCDDNAGSHERWGMDADSWRA